MLGLWFELGLVRARLGLGLELELGLALGLGLGLLLKRNTLHMALRHYFPPSFGRCVGNSDVTFLLDVSGGIFLIRTWKRKVNCTDCGGCL